MTSMENFSTLQQRFTNYLLQNSFQNEPQTLYEPVNYILNLGGKRIRPILLLMACQIFDDNIEKALPASFSVELFHNFSLVHDDIMDQAPLRRGKPAVHKKYDTNTGILSGDVMLVYVYEYLMKLDSSLPIPQIISIFNDIAIKVCEGQQFDMDFENRVEVDINEYLKMIELKTGVLLAGALKIGGLIGGANLENANHLYEFGRNIGIAFQLQDDILDTYGDPEKFGKKVGGDIAQNKKTYLFLKALELAEPNNKQNLIDLYQDSSIEEDTKIDKVTSLFNGLKVRELSEVVKEEYLKTAFGHLDAVTVPEERKEVLRLLANELMGRDH